MCCRDGRNLSRRVRPSRPVVAAVCSVGEAVGICGTVDLLYALLTLLPWIARHAPPSRAGVTSCLSPSTPDSPLSGTQTEAVTDPRGADRQRGNAAGAGLRAAADEADSLSVARGLRRLAAQLDHGQSLDSVLANSAYPPIWRASCKPPSGPATSALCWPSGWRTAAPPGSIGGRFRRRSLIRFWCWR